MDTLHEDRYTFPTVSPSVFLRMKHISDKSCRETWITHFMFNNTFFPKSRRLWGDVEKYFRAGQATDDNMAHVHSKLGT